MRVSFPDPRQWTPENRAEFCRTSRLTEAALDAYEAMHEAWRAVEFVSSRRASQERTGDMHRAYATFRAKAAIWQQLLREHGGLR